tara:strand:- start:484451 stop:484987 length:537 start_codon:yes stop_codon:yes gene_type:complete
VALKTTPDDKNPGNNRFKQVLKDRQMKLTAIAKKNEVKHEWYVIDATDQPMGRLSSVVAKMLRGKHKPSFTPNVDTGDNIIIINADKVRLTGGRKLAQLVHYWHTGFPGGIKEITAERELAGKNPERLVTRSVKRMMPKESPLSRKQFSKLHVYAGSEHPHGAQKPKEFDISSIIAKK